MEIRVNSQAGVEQIPNLTVTFECAQEIDKAWMEVFTVNAKTYKELSHVFTALHATLQALNKMVKIIMFMKHILRKAQTLVARAGI